MKVKVKYYGYLQELAGKNEDEVEIPKTISLIELFDLLPLNVKKACIINKKEFNPTIKVFKNGVEVQNIDLNQTKVQNGDLIQLLPPIGGGNV